MEPIKYRFITGDSCKIVEADEERTLSFTISDETVDRYKEVMKVAGCELAEYEKNPVVLWAHDHTIPVIGRAYGTRILKSKKSIFSKVEFAPTEFAVSIYELYKRGFMKGVSIGFIPKETEEVEEKVGAGDDTPVRYIKRWELLEFSCVPIPANPNALITNEVPELARKYFEAWSEPQEEFCKKYFETALPEGYCIACEIKTEDSEELAQVNYEDGQLVDAEGKPYENEHSCRLEDPDQFDKFARKNCEQKSDDKCIDVVYGIKDNKSKIQALRYNKEVWTESAAKSHCKSKEGMFEAAKKEAEEQPKDFDLLIASLNKEEKQKLTGLLLDDLNDIDLDKLTPEREVEVDIDGMSTPDEPEKSSKPEIADDSTEIPDDIAEKLIGKIQKEITDEVIGAIRRDKLGIVDD